MRRTFMLPALSVVVMLLTSCGGGGGTAPPPPPTPPAVSATTPANNTTGLPITTKAISATFDRSIDPATLTGTTFTVKDGAGAQVAGTVAASGTTATLTPSALLAPSTTYTATLTTGVKDTAGTPLASAYTWSFTTTSDGTLPSVTATTPAANATGIGVRTAITLTFSEKLAAATINAASIVLTDNAGTKIAGSVALTTDTTVTFTPTAHLAYGTTHTITVTPAVTDFAGNTMASAFTASFTTLPAYGSWQATATTGAPAMTGHRAVWTGTQMIAWDGTNGGRYTPATNSWLPVAALPTDLAPRLGGVAVWTGTEMEIWGGFDPATLTTTNTGGRYNPATNSWSMPNNPAPIAGRYGHSAVWDNLNGQMIVWGGFDPTLPASYANGATYNPGTDNWTLISTVNAPAARSGHVAVWTGSTMIVWGGIGSTGSILNTGGVYDPTANTWTTMSTTGAPVPAVGGTLNAVWTGTEMIVWGGPSVCGAYNPTTDTWRPISTTSVATPPVAGTAVWSGSLMIVWADGVGGRYDPVTDTWTAAAVVNAPPPISGHTAVWTGTTMIVYGGIGTPGQTLLNSGGIYTP